jgi:hypothetical protein
MHAILLGENQVEPFTLEKLIDKGGDWYAYQNQAMDSACYGLVNYLCCGEGRTHATPPAHLPDGAIYGTGWKWLLVGKVNLKTGTVEDFKDKEN